MWERFTERAKRVVSAAREEATRLNSEYVRTEHILLGLCAGAGTSAPALAALQEKAQSKVPSLGYGMACAVGNVLLALWGTLTVLLLAPT